MGELALSRDDQYRARPTVRIDDRPNPRLSELINQFCVREAEGGMSSLELRLVNSATPDSGGDEQLALEDEHDLKLGSQLKLYAGDERQPREVFRGVVSGLEAEFPEHGPAELLVLAEDALQLARLARRSSVHDRLKLSDLVDRVASQVGLTAKVTGLRDDLGTQIQLNESDLAFLRRLLARNDADLQVVGRELHVTPRREVVRGSLELQWHSQLFDARFQVDLADQITEVTTSGWNPSAGSRVAGSSNGANLGPGGGRSGARVLRDALGQRSEHVSSPTVISDAEASALADAVFDQRARRFVRVDASADGNPLIRVGSSVRLSGFSRRFDNTYYVVSVHHRYDRQRQYVTEFEAECAYLGNP